MNKASNLEHRVTVVNKYGEKLVGVLHETCSVELVILCHGFRSTKECKPLVTIANDLVKQGISAFRFDFAGNGESDGSFQYGNYRREADDLRAVVLHFSGAKHVIQAIVGHSKGGNVVLLYASQYRDVKVVVNISGRFNLVRGIEGRLGKDFMKRIENDGFIDVRDKTEKVLYRVTKESLVDRLTTDVGPACLRIEKECRVLTVHGSRDEIVPAEDAMEFDKLISSHKLHIIGGANHEYTSHQVELASTVVNFIRADQKTTPTSNQVSSCPRANQSGSSRL
ncbi:hypothetical protein IFM89_033040 [Coptis chinensis]|uniref:Serine aminopeptidase S33 domain-containing protein n=1 Tax=Coptis chinensis TaxID=261450 RepID=A0A835IDL3_9MAGN|nr:hypothetical protein IFM89_033040 [Coptis chinensis]